MTRSGSDGAETCLGHSTWGDGHTEWNDAGNPPFRSRMVRDWTGITWDMLVCW